MDQKLQLFLDELSDYPDFAGVVVQGPNTLNNFGSNPLHVAAIQNRIEIIKLLIVAGVDINHQGEHGYTPLHEAVEQNNKDAVEVLLQLGADDSIENDHGMLALEICEVEDEDRSEIAKILKAFGQR